MKAILHIPEKWFHSLRSLLSGGVETGPQPETPQTRGEGLARLHDYQHQVILGLFRINIAGLAAFLLIVASFTLFTVTDPSAPGWISAMMASVGVLVLLGCYRTVKEFRFYRKNYTAMMDQLQSRVRQYINRAAGDQKSTNLPAEPAVLSVLRPKEHKGWDAKPCKKCQKALELLAGVCQHCGQEQEDTLIN